MFKKLDHLVRKIKVDRGVTIGKECPGRIMTD